MTPWLVCGCGYEGELSQQDLNHDVVACPACGEEWPVPAERANQPTNAPLLPASVPFTQVRAT